MNNNLVVFLSGGLAIQVQTANDMKKFVDWLKKHDLQDILVANKNYYNDYFKISFWKDLAKKCANKWIHPHYLTIYFGWNGDRLYWNYDYKETAQDFSIIGAQEL